MIESKTVNAAAESKNSAESKVGGSDGNDNHLRNRKLDSLDLDVDENLDDVYQKYLLFCTEIEIKALYVYKEIKCLDCSVQWSTH